MDRKVLVPVDNVDKLCTQPSFKGSSVDNYVDKLWMRIGDILLLTEGRIRRESEKRGLKVKVKKAILFSLCLVLWLVGIREGFCAPLSDAPFNRFGGSMFPVSACRIFALRVSPIWNG